MASSVRRAEDRAAQPQNSGNVLRGQLTPVCGVDQSSESVFDPDRLGPVIGSGSHDCSDRGVEARGVAPSCQDANAHAGTDSNRRTKLACVQICLGCDNVLGLVKVPIAAAKDAGTFMRAADYSAAAGREDRLAQAA